MRGENESAAFCSHGLMKTISAAIETLSRIASRLKTKTFMLLLYFGVSDASYRFKILLIGYTAQRGVLFHM